MSGATLADSRVDIGVFGWLNRIMLLCIVVAVITLIILKYLPLIRKNEAMNRELQVLREEVQGLEIQANRNQAWIESLRSDPRTNEREAREKLGLARPEEQVVTFQNANSR